MKKKKLIFFDIDGTLLTEEKTLPLSTKQAIYRLKELGHELAIATGRAPFMFKELREELGIDSFVSFNGQYVVYNGKPVYQNPLDQEELQLLIGEAERQQNPLIYENHEQMCTNIEFHPHIEEGMGSLKLAQKPFYNPVFYQGRDIYQSLLFCNETEQAGYREKFSQFEFVRWHELSVDVLPAGGSKAKGIEALIRYLNIPLEDVYAFGDGMNDIEMLTFVQNSVAMGNAVDQVKAVAKYVTKHVDEDGLLRGLELVGLLEKEKEKEEEAV
ncbi:Cof-type HAD-IIB family hydrolase [Neobacillus jeddahensis]|uniref:Cof-type HAD-IIB family hydrolase n=1 Tax=Neobacillus jeddahensis TaxID=1461580 RepID=UPI00058D6C17|nr:Cof-type HAD-IIB family hydrolase [Neobacillus jeddahensis]